MRIGFLVSDLGLSGGINVVLKHASYLASMEGNKVTIITQREHPSRYPWSELEDRKITVVDLTTAQDSQFDVVLATWWETVFNLFSVPSLRYAWFCQSLEHRFYSSDDSMHALAQCMETIPIPCITESSWIQNQMLALNPQRKVWLVQNGVDKNVFKKNSHLDDKDGSDQIRILVEGNLDNPIKGVADALQGVFLSKVPFTVRHITTTQPSMSDWRYTAVVGPLSFEEMAKEYSWCDVLVKTSRVEGMFGPPLEAFHCGATAIVTPVTGHDEYIVHGFNSLVVEWDSPASVAKGIEKLYVDRQALSALKAGATTTASNWPSWDDSSQNFLAAITELLHTDMTLKNDELRIIINGVRSIRVSMHKTRTLLLGFVKVADDRLELIHSLQSDIRNDQSVTPTRFLTRVVNRLKRLLRS